jgi:hypothetical protein
MCGTTTIMAIRFQKVKSKEVEVRVARKVRENGKKYMILMDLGYSR